LSQAISAQVIVTYAPLSSRTSLTQLSLQQIHSSMNSSFMLAFVLFSVALHVSDTARIEVGDIQGEEQSAHSGEGALEASDVTNIARETEANDIDAAANNEDKTDASSAAVQAAEDCEDNTVSISDTIKANKTDAPWPVKTGVKKSMKPSLPGTINKISGSKRVASGALAAKRAATQEAANEWEKSLSHWCLDDVSCLKTERRKGIQYMFEIFCRPQDEGMDGKCNVNRLHFHVDSLQDGAGFLTFKCSSTEHCTMEAKDLGKASGHFVQLGTRREASCCAKLEGADEEFSDMLALAKRMIQAPVEGDKPKVQQERANVTSQLEFPALGA